MNRHVVDDSSAVRGISANERRASIKNNPLRAAAIVKGRQRLAKVAGQLNPAFRPLSALRLAAGLSQAELAEKMEMVQPNIARLEKRPGDPSLSTLQKLAIVLGVDIREVIAAVEATNKAEANRG
jgi:DNA-binding XRE family transcriptional regulator